ncbi:MAG TPA: pilus assembly protein PilM [Kofleriaceae bacterium]|nr:pilus assembly protein PilM [Kofleriaceae bacterium]
MFAVDLGAWSVKLALASPGIRGASLINVVERLVPPGDEPAEVRARGVLAALLAELRLRDDPGYLAISGDQVFTQVLEFPFKNLRRAELDKAVGGELEGVVPVDLEDMVYAFEPLPAPPAAPASDEAVDPAGPGAPAAAASTAPKRGRVAPPADGMRVLTYALRKERVEQLIDLGKTCGFDPRGILALGGAAIRLVAATPSLARARTDGPVAVIDIGHERTDVVVVAGGKAVFSRSIARAGKQVTDAIATHWKLPWADAERAKHSDGFIASSAEPATSEAWRRIHQVTIVEMAPLARDLRQTFAACRARTGFAPIAALLVGGGSRLRGSAAFFSEELALPAWRLTAEDLMALGGARLGADAHTLPVDSAALTVGLAFDAAGGRPLFDLRSGDLAVKVDFSFLRAKAVPLGAAALAIAACAAGSAYADLYRIRKAEKVLTARLATESAEHFGTAKTAEEILATTSPGGAAAGSPIPKTTAWDLMLEISNHVPGKDKITLDLDHITIDDTKVDLTGTTKTPEEIDMLIAELKKIECFKNNVTRGPTETAANGAKRFKLTITASCLGGA